MLPVFNTENFILRSIQSCLNQSFKDFELIVVDDGSTDQTSKILHEIQSKDQRIKLVKHQENLGVVAAMKSGVSVSSGKYLARMDADDWNESERFQKQISLLESSPSLSATSCQINVTGTESDPEANADQGFERFAEWQNSLITSEQIFQDRFVELPLCNPTMMIHRSVYDELHGYTNFDGPEDYDFWLRFFESSHRIEKIPEKLFHWQDRSERLTRSDHRYDQKKFIETKSRFLARLNELNQSEVCILGTGKIARLIARGLLSKDIKINSFIDVSEKNEGKTIYDIPIIHMQNFKNTISSKSFFLIGVGGEGRRKSAEVFLEKHGLVKGQNFFSVT